MSVELRAAIICDGCNARVEGEIGRRSTLIFESYGDAKQKTDAQGWIVLPRYGVARHFCKACADKPSPKKAAPLTPEARG